MSSGQPVEREPFLTKEDVPYLLLLFSVSMVGGFVGVALWAWVSSF